MTAAEKARELIDKFYQTTPNEAFYNPPVGLVQNWNARVKAKQCALICVDEQVESWSQYKGMYEQEVFDSELEFLQQLQLAIEKL